MARLEVKATVTAPAEISIPLVRGDHHEVSGVFRVCFECGLAVFSTLMGYMLSLQSVDRIHWFFMSVAGVATLSFLWLSFRFGSRAKQL